MKDSDLDLIVASHREDHRHDRRVRARTARSRDVRGDHGGPPAQSGRPGAPAGSAHGDGPASISGARTARRPAQGPALRSPRPRASRGQADPRQAGAERGGQGDPEANRRRILPGRRLGPGDAIAGQVGLPRGRGAGRSRADPRRPTLRRPRSSRPPPDLLRGLPPAPRPRLGHLPARRDPGPGHDRPRHRRRRPAGRRDHGRVQQGLHAGLQHAVLRRRRGPPDPWPRPSRDRPRSPGRAFGRPGPARQRDLPVHDPRDQRHPRIERVLVDGLGLRGDPQPDGRRRADLRPGRRDLDRPRRRTTARAATSS